MHTDIINSLFADMGIDVDSKGLDLKKYRIFIKMLK
jgi:hypothetical protein